ncbi:MAG: 4-(cytidine 5'-diphospho)-2-C-methyl-D-erythritol kinase [Bacillota bacterium]|nr:4-(cytidine 5'-diphospho)-2-C-methyl-D-erythritol kinase [Bacillota bacterium]
MAEILQNSYAKINLTLDVLSKRQDSYHEVRMIMQTIELHDTLRIETAGEPGEIRVRSNLSYLPTDSRNLAYKAAQLFFDETGIKNPGLTIDLKKRVPVSAGLAGGSGNAAAVLKGLNALFGAGISHEKLCKLGEAIGADVPFCLTGGTMLAEGIGEKLTPLKAVPHAFVVLTKPAFSVSTAAVYKALDSRRIISHPDTAGALKAIDGQNLAELSIRLYNVLFDVVRLQHRTVSEIREELIVNGALGAVMSGSGPSVFGFFEKKEAAQTAYNTLKSKYRDTFLTETRNPG